MARVTVEDCLKNVKNRFELVIVAAKRARQLMRGKDAKVEWDNDKPTVVALREIAEGFVDFDTKEEHKEEPQLFITKRETTITVAPVANSAPPALEESPATPSPTADQGESAPSILTSETLVVEVEETQPVSSNDQPQNEEKPSTEENSSAENTNKSDE